VSVLPQQKQRFCVFPRRVSYNYTMAEIREDKGELAKMALRRLLAG